MRDDPAPRCTRCSRTTLNGGRVCDSCLRKQRRRQRASRATARKLNQIHGRRV